MWFDVRFEREGARALARVRVTLCPRHGVQSTLLREKVEQRARGSKEKRRTRGKVALEEKRNTERRKIGERDGGGGLANRSGCSVELCSGTVVPCTQPNNRDQPSLMCT